MVATDTPSGHSVPYSVDKPLTDPDGADDNKIIQGSLCCKHPPEPNSQAVGQSNWFQIDYFVVQQASLLFGEHVTRAGNPVNFLTFCSCICLVT